MKVFVTGGTGFTGKALIERLVAEGNEVITVDDKDGLNSDEIKSLGVKLIKGSVTDKKLMDEMMQGVEVVFHIAAAFREMDVSNHVYRDVNVEGTRFVLEAALKHNIRKFVYCSTCGVHGNVEVSPGDETAPIQPADYYQQSKYDGEVVVNEYIKKGLNCTTLRPAAIYGPGDPARYLMIYKRVSKGFFPMFGNGKTLYHPLYIDNLVDAFLLASETGKGDGEAYLIADEEYVEIQDLVKKVGESLNVSLKMPHFPLMPLVVAGHICEKVCKPFKISPPIFPRRVDWYRQNRAFKIDKAKRDLGYQPKVKLTEGLKNTAKWYREEGFIK